MARLVACVGFCLIVLLGIAAAPAEGPAWKAGAKGCSERFAHGAVWDGKREVMLVFGGEGRKGDAFVFFNDLWTYSPAKDEWKELSLKEQPLPSKRGYHACAWDSKRNQMWVFGGSGETFQGLDDLWAFDPEKLQWTKLEPENPRPKGRLSATMHYHPGSDSLVLVAGLNGFGPKSVPVRDLWVYDIKANKWTEKKCVAPQLWQCASALDPKRGLLILHGGFDERFEVRTETWVYELADDKWREPVEGKRFVDAHAGVWDADQGRMLVYGGANSQKGAKGYDDVWAFDPDKSTWKQLEVAGDKPGGRAYHSAVWEPKSRALIVFGGTANQFSDPPRENQVWLLKLPAK
jgi:N-acetylneuraminic acid mutarotase